VTHCLIQRRCGDQIHRRGDPGWRHGGRRQRPSRQTDRVTEPVTRSDSSTETTLESPRPLGIPRPPLRSSSLRCLRDRGTTEAASPFLNPPGRWMAGRATWSAGWMCTYRLAPLAAAALRVARDRPFRACGRSPHRPRPFRAKMDVPSAPAGIPVGCAPCGLSRSSAWCRLRCRAPHRGARSRRQSPWTRTRTSGRTRAGISRWPLAPGGSARGAGWMASLRRALARARWALAKARARARDG